MQTLKRIFLNTFFPFSLLVLVTLSWVPSLQAQRVNARLNSDQKRMLDFLSTGRPEERQMAMMQCGLSRSRFCTRTLIKYLNDVDPLFRFEAAQALGQIADPTSLQPLTEALEKVSQEGKDDQDIQGLQKEIEANTLYPNESDAKRKKAFQFVVYQSKLLWAIGQIGSLSSVEKIKPYLQNQSSSVRRAAVLALGNVKSEDAVSALKSAYGEEKNDRIKAALAYSVLKSDMGNSQLSKDLIALLFSPDWLARYDTAGYIESLHLREARDNLLKALRAEEWEEVRLRLFKAYQMSINQTIE